MTILLVGASAAGPRRRTAKRGELRKAASVINELRSAPDNSIPESIWDRARCVVVMPSVKKAAFVVGGEFGRVW